MTARPSAPGRLLIWRLKRNRPAWWAARFLVGLYALALVAPFVAPYGSGSDLRQAPYHPPSRVVWKPALPWKPQLWVVATRLEGDSRSYRPTGGLRPVVLFAAGDSYEVLPGIRADRHLFGVGAAPAGKAAAGGAAPAVTSSTGAAPDQPAGAEIARLYLMGADQLGRDVFSRLLYGARVSLSVGLIGIALSFVLGLLVGGVAGYYGGWLDVLLMRGSEILMSVPALYLILALRAAFPASMPSHWTYLMIIVILSFVTWTGLGRIVRGMVLSIRSRDYVAAAQTLGYSPFRIIARHILPNTLSFVVVAATIAIPGYILSEVALSFLGVGIQEPTASWGNMLQQAASVNVMESSPWILWPGVFIFVTVFAFNVLGDGVRDALDPRQIDA